MANITKSHLNVRDTAEHSIKSYKYNRAVLFLTPSHTHNDILNITKKYFHQMILSSANFFFDKKEYLYQCFSIHFETNKSVYIIFFEKGV